MQSILVASDLSVRSDRALRRAVRLAETLGARLVVGHVVDSAMPLELAETVRVQAAKTLEDQFQACKPDPDLDHEVVTIIGDPLIEVNILAAGAGAELVVLGLHRERSHMDLIRQTTMERLIRASECPVLLVVNETDSPYRHLLCGVDMSQACANAITAGRTIAPGADVTLFHAFHVPYRRMTNPSDSAAATLPFRHEAEQEFARWRTDNALPADLPQPVFVDASPSVALDRMLVDHQPDLLTLGAHARSNLGRYILGSFTSALIRNPPCDLLVAR